MEIAFAWQKLPSASGVWKYGMFAVRVTGATASRVALLCWPKRATTPASTFTSPRNRTGKSALALARMFWTALRLGATPCSTTARKMSSLVAK